MELKECLSTDDFKINKDDLVNIAISQYETEVDEELLECENHLLDCKEDMDKLVIKHNKERIKLIKSKLDSKAKDAVASLSKLNIHASYDFDTLSSKDTETIKYQLSFQIAKSDKDMGRYVSEGFSTVGDIDENKAIISVREKMKVGIADMSKIRKTIDVCRHKLNNMAKTERKTKAALTSNLMGKFTDGKDIVAALLESVQGPQKRLN